jgi:acyl-CoA thioester hydrolase
MEVRYGDLDAQGHLNNAKYLTYFEQARVCYLTELRLFLTEQSFAEIGVIIADVHIKYEEPVLWGTGVAVGVRTEKIGGKSLTLNQCLADESRSHAYASGSVVLVAYDYGRHQSLPVPAHWRDRLMQFEGRPLD